MVKYSTIVKVIESEVLKCYPTVGEMKTILSQMSREEKYEQLMGQGLLNPLEVDDYDLARDIVFDGEDVWGDETLEEATDKVFYYERRLIEGLRKSEPPNVDVDRFNIDQQFDDSEDLETKMGKLESNQIKHQERLVNGGTVTADEKWAMTCYLANSTWINDHITHKEYLNKLDSEDRKTLSEMDGVIDKADGLLKPTVLYRGGKLDNIHLKVGDHSKFKRYTSTSFQRDVGLLFKGDGDDDFLYTIYAPKKTKGLCLNTPYFDNTFVDEHEYLLPRNIGYTVLDIDYENHRVSVVLDEP